MKRPAFQFYPADWLNDLSLRQCSPMTRSLWMDAICLMHDGDPYGHLRTIGGDITVTFLARTCGMSVPQVNTCLAELERFQVFSRNESGTIYSRRMVRDEKVREARAKGGCASLDNPNVPRPKRINARMAARISLVGSSGGSPSASSSSSSSFTAASAGLPPPLECQFPETLATARVKFPETDAEMACKIVAAARQVVSDATDREVAMAVSIYSRRAKQSAGFFVRTVPGIISQICAKARDSPDPSETEAQQLEKARELWRKAPAEDRVLLEDAWPQLRPEGGPNAEKRA